MSNVQKSPEIVIYIFVTNRDFLYRKERPKHARQMPRGRAVIWVDLTALLLISWEAKLVEQLNAGCQATESTINISRNKTHCGTQTHKFDRKRTSPQLPHATTYVVVFFRFSYVFKHHFFFPSQLVRDFNPQRPFGHAVVTVIFPSPPPVRVFIFFRAKVSALSLFSF